MKRDGRALSIENAAHDADAQLRRRLQRESEAEERAERLAQASEAKTKQLSAYLAKWKEENISIATDFLVTEPVRVPNGSFLNFAFPCDPATSTLSSPFGLT